MDFRFGGFIPKDLDYALIVSFSCSAIL